MEKPFDKMYIGVLAVMALKAVYAPFVAMCLWDWFAAPALRVPEISFFGMLGLMWLISLLTKMSDGQEWEWGMTSTVVDTAVPEERRAAVEKAREQGKSSRGLLVYNLAKLAGHTVTLVLGFLLHTCLM
jgi:type VI protein secretion system component VasK